MSLNLLPAERIALTVALAQVKRGEPPAPNTATMCVLALARAHGVYDWTKESGALNAIDASEGKSGEPNG